ncbi:MAG TPA: 30S ribosomal protein S12 methylthiotransferase RimO [Anaerolinea thermolimosa]|uniref:Ribosomal protein uS12 methylthiotransferase RimO n=1 Tax=Anaerolinea thermolimosa TaxID=229919 RepID=A0A3D1JHZ9_9CHLR|nr:30S ribosomal protein S12 methylthiotransferase RimO [Anaerolinea thermolimosa]GAP07280.1 SSU ribosomal protein S12P methylthiotransferase [Anaerolinea thermolimosa]HCE17246.1 30S ribosomal protein S12 methylthiotransferase RimO [Anaerolinea thermolimosa]
MSKKYYLVSLGCAKNTVDSQSMGTLLSQAGYRPTDKRSEADVLIVNTCGFIGPARQESIETLKELAKRKKRGQFLVAAGCLTERYREQVASEVPGIDGILGTRRWMDIVDLVQQLRPGQQYPQPLYHLPDVPTVGKDEKGVHRVSVQGTSAYLKIADGCRRPCAFCAIPLIKGTAVSRPPEAIFEEVRALQKAGVQEVILIAQDTTDYGHDLGLKDGLSFLLEGILREAPEIPWVRILYAYPGYVTDRLIEVMARSPRVVPYLDMPLQHAHPQTLKRMRRPANMDWVVRTLEKMRSAIPDLALRTTFIVGYPGETEEEFETLLRFVEETRFDHVGIFPFSFEKGTPSEPLGDPIPREVKEERLQRLATLQEKISLERNQSYVGKVQQVIVEGANQGITVGRAYHDAPEIDGMVFIEGQAPVGEIVSVRITGAMVHDLTGVIVESTGN